jgi:hypothetical protein
VTALLAVLHLALARALARPGRWLLAAAGIAAAVALLGIAAGAGAVAGERSARETLRGLPPSQRDLRVTWNGGLPAGIDRRARAALHRFTPSAQTRAVLFLPTEATPGPVVQLAGIDPIRRWVRMVSGRLPRTCGPTRCEVVQLGGPRAKGPIGRFSTNLVVVGRGALTSSVPLGFVPRPEDTGIIAEQRQSALLVAADPAGLDALPSLASVYRTQSWSAPLTLGDRPSWQLDGLGAELAAARNGLAAEDHTFALDAPLDGLAAASHRASAARRRVLLVGVGAAALLAAFAVLAAGALRRDLAAERARLERRGARRWQLATLVIAEAGWPALAGVTAGGALAVVVSALRASAAEIPVGPVLRHTFLTPAALLAALVCWTVACALIALGARTWRPGSGRAIDLVALGAAGALAAALSRGGADAGEAGDPLPTLLPPLTLLVAGLVVARVVGPLLRGTEGATRRAPLPARLAALGLARAPEGPAATVAVVAVACGLACFSTAYGATLHDNERDQAAARVPLDLTASPGPSFVRPLDAAPLARWRALVGPHGAVVPVLRASASVPRGAERATLTALGIPAGALTQLRGWRHGQGSAPVATLAHRLRSPASALPAGPHVSRGDRELRLRARSSGDALDVTAQLVAADGSSLAVPLGRAGPRARTLRAPLPRAAAGRRLAALEFDEPFGLAATRGHNEAENPSSPAITGGTLVLAGARLGTRALDLPSWVGSGPVRAPRPTPSGGVRARFAFDTGGRALLRPREPTDDRALPVLVDGATASGAARGRLLPLDVDDVAVRARVVGTVRRMPTVGPDSAGVVVFDERALATVLTGAAPGSARPDEVWLRADPPAEAAVRRAFAEPPLNALRLQSRRAFERRLRDDPLSRELARTLTLAAIVALALGALGVLLTTTAALGDDGAELYDLEATGADPRVLRADVRLRAALLAGLGLAAGLAVGLGLVSLVVDAVQLTATGRSAFPPLVTRVPVGGWALVALAFALACAVLTFLGTHRAFTAPVPRRPPGIVP